MFGELDELAVPGPSTEEHVRGRPVASKPPMRLDVLVVRDTRLGAVEDDMGSGGCADALGDVGRGCAGAGCCLLHDDGVASLERLRVHLRWACEQEWVLGFDRDLRAFTACLRLAGMFPGRVWGCVGHRTRRMSWECGGTLLASPGPIGGCRVYGVEISGANGAASGHDSGCGCVVTGPLDGVCMVPCVRGCGNVITVVSSDPFESYRRRCVCRAQNEKIVVDLS